ncbi:universal stress protein A [Gammaproteobacteria bacterium 45_16_T64]|nr:universal stress protein A [Gammaproteobacteria bacterium 45_16_T64]
MSSYTHVLLATDFNEETIEVVQRARSIADQNKSTLSVIHVIEPISIAYAGEFPVDLGDIHRELEKQANLRLNQLAKELSIPEAQCFLEIGLTEKEILRVADEESIDLIVVGSHNKHGLSLLLGSTANAILHHAPCDVLAIRVPKISK